MWECWVSMVGSVELHGGYCLIAPWGALGYRVGSGGLHVGSVGLYDGNVKLYGGECWVTWWDVGLHGGVLGYMVGCCLIAPWGALHKWETRKSCNSLSCWIH